MADNLLISERDLKVYILTRTEQRYTGRKVGTEIYYVKGGNKRDEKGFSD